MKKIIVLLMCGFMFLSGCQKGGDGPGTASLKISVEPPATGKVQKNAKVTLPAVVDSLSIVVRDTNNAVVASGSLGGGSYDVILVVPSGVALSVTAEAYNGANLLYSGSSNITLQEGELASLNINMNYVGSTYTLGGSLSGLVGSVVLQNNGGDDLTLTADGAFTFSTSAIFGQAYNITVLTQPAGQTCTIANASGSATANVININVTCAASVFTIGGTVSGLTGTVVLQNNGGDNLTVSANGAFQFPAAVASGSAYVVTVLTQPAGQTCTVTSGTGTATANINNVVVTCVSNFSVGGTVSGLTGTVVLQNNGADNLSVSANGVFTFANTVTDGSTYSVTVLTQPAGQVCTPTSNTGTATANVTGVVVTCTTATTFTIGGSVSGLIGTVVLQNNGGDDLTLTTDGAFVFTTAVSGVYAVTVSSQPAGQTCSVINPGGTAVENVNNVIVTCATAVASGYLYYRDAAVLPSVAANLVTIDPANPAVTSDVTGNVLLEPPTFKSRITDVYAGSYNNTNRMMTGFHRYAIVYVSGGSIYKRSALVGGGAAVQLSNVTNITDSPGDGTGTPSATDLCEMDVVEDFAVPDNSVIYYGLSGTDQLCGTGDDPYFALTMTTSSTAPPTSVADPLAYTGIDINDTSSATLAYIGSLALNGSGALVRYDAAFSNPVVVDNGPFTLLNSMADTLQNNTMLLQVDNTIRVFDPGSNTLGTSLVTLAGTTNHVECVYDAAGCYFSDDSAGSPTNVLYRIPLPNAAAAEVVLTEPTGNITYVDVVTLTHVVFDVDGVGIRSVDRTASNATSSLALVDELLLGGGSPLIGDTALLTTQISAGNKIYINEFVWGAVSYTYRAYLVSDDGVEYTQLGDAYWQGFSYSPDFGVDNYLGAVNNVVLLQRTTGSELDSNATLHTYDALSGLATGISPGVVPADIDYMGFLWGDFRNNMLVEAYLPDGNDMLYLDLMTSSSLVRVTNDGSATNEQSVYFGD